MHLTREEERIYDGESGWASQVSMKILVRLGELFNADKLIQIESAHVSGVSYKTLGDAPADFLEALANTNAKVNVRSTLNPQSIDEEYLCTKLPADLSQKQSSILKHFESMGFTESLTCTPYYLKMPESGSHLAWSESSAVVYANSVVGAWTNREGGPSALAAAIIGKTPDYGIHRAENRQPKVTVSLKTPLRSGVEFGALGIFLGEILEDKIPLVRGLGNASADDLKQLSAALASTGMVNMLFNNNGVNIKAGKLEKEIVEPIDIRRTIEKLSTGSGQRPDLVFLGCPHCSLNELKQIADLVSKRKAKDETLFWVCTSRCVKEKAQKYVERIERSGGHVISDTCAVVTWTDKLGIKTIMTNSAKTAHYAPALNRAETRLATLDECITTAFEG